MSKKVLFWNTETAIVSMSHPTQPGPTSLTLSIYTGPKPFYITWGKVYSIHICIVA